MDETSPMSGCIPNEKDRNAQPRLDMLGGGKRKKGGQGGGELVKG